VDRPGATSRPPRADIKRSAIGHPAASKRGFSMIDLLVSITVIAILISIISPTLSHVREAADKVVCASNLRQVGLCLSMYQDDYDGFLPAERRAAYARDATATPDPQIAHTGETPSAWSGLGWLVADGYLSTPEVLYCPAHTGEVTHENHAPGWRMLDREIRTNYAYRGALAEHAAPNRGPDASGGDSPQAFAVLAADAFSTPGDISHASGFNTLSLSLSVAWHGDAGDELVTLARSSAGGVNPNDAWTILDRENERIDSIDDHYNDHDPYNNDLRLPRR